jgi:hypothetical protein
VRSLDKVAGTVIKGYWDGKRSVAMFVPQEGRGTKRRIFRPGGPS